MCNLLIYILKKYFYKFQINIIWAFTDLNKFISLIFLKLDESFKKFTNKLHIFFFSNAEKLYAFISNSMHSFYIKINSCAKINKNYLILKIFFIFIKVLKLFVLNLIFCRNCLIAISRRFLFYYIVFTLFSSVFLKQVFLFFFNVCSSLFFFFLRLKYHIGYFFKIFFILIEVILSRLYRFFELHLVYLVYFLIELFATYKPIVLEKFYLFKKEFKSFLYNRLFYDFFLGAFLYWSQASYSHTGRSFTSREDIIENYKFLGPLIKRLFYWSWVYAYYDFKYACLQFYYFYKSFVINFFFWVVKNYIFNFLANIFIFTKKNYVFNFFFFFFILITLKFFKIIFLFVFLNFFKFKIFKMPLYVIFNFYRNPHKRLCKFFEHLSQRLFRHFILSWLFIPSRLFFRRKKFFQKNLNFKLSYMIFHQSYTVLYKMHSLFDVWAYKYFLNNSFVRAIKRVRYRWRKRYYLYRISIKFKHKFGLAGRFGIIKTIFRDIFYFLLANTFKYAYVMAHVFNYIINKIVYVIKKIIENANK